ncbi:MAG: pyridoxal-phosphate dependent enzyme, partial [Gammaproteobacteria bacterium]
DVMHGYTLLASETLDQLAESERPTHIFLQAGVGGMAAAVLAGFWLTMGAERPVAILAEPDKAACCYLSIQAGEPTVAPGDLDSMMAGLACGEVSLLAWDVLKAGAQAAVSMGDQTAFDCMRLLADGCCGDAPIVAGESAVAGLAALVGLMQNDKTREQLMLNRHSRVLVIGTEGDTDPDLFQEIIGRSAEAVRGCA